MLARYFAEESRSAPLDYELQSGPEASDSGADTLRVGYPVYRYNRDTLFLIYSRFGSLTAEDRASRITQWVGALAENELYSSDSLVIEEVEGN